MKADFSFMGITSKSIFLSIAVFFSTAGLANAADSVGYEPVAPGTTIHFRKVETIALDKQQRLVMKTILYVRDTKEYGKLNSQIIGSETRVYDPETAKVTHVAVVGVAPYPIESNGAYVVVSPGARNVSLKGDHNTVTFGGDNIPPPVER